MGDEMGRMVFRFRKDIVEAGTGARGLGFGEREKQGRRRRGHVDPCVSEGRRALKKSMRTEGSFPMMHGSHVARVCGHWQMQG